MRRIKSLLIFLSVLLLAGSSCMPNRKYVYLTNPKNNPDMDSSRMNVDMIPIPEHFIAENDVLKIEVSPDGLPMTSTIREDGSKVVENTSYQVDPKGRINLPLVGYVNVKGLTCDQLHDLLLKEYAKTYASPSVFVSLMEFSVSVIGEVDFPGVRTVRNPSINIFEALSLAGDLTDGSKRFNIKVMRRNKAGKLDIYTVDFSSREILVSPAFYLQSNDIIYVEPYQRKRVLDVTQKIFFIVTTANIFSTLFSRYLPK